MALMTSGRVCWTEGQFVGVPGKLIMQSPNGEDVEIENMDLQSIDLDTGEAECLSRIDGQHIVDGNRENVAMGQTLYFPGRLRFEW